MAQGKEWKKDEVMDELKPYFLLGYDVAKACRNLGIPRTTVQTWLENDELLRLKVNSWRNSVNVKARENIVKEILKANPDTVLSQWWLSRMDDDMTDKVKSISMTPEEFAKQFEIDDDKDNNT